MSNQARLERGRRAALAGAGGAIGAGVLFAPAAEAATFTVTNLNDVGAGSLRQAVTSANVMFGADQVVFQTGLSGTITLASGDIDVRDESLEIIGPGAGQITIDGGANDRIFDLYSFDAPDRAVRISGLTLTNGSTIAGGGAVYQGAGGGFPPDLTLDGVTISASYANNDGGGLVSRGGDLTIANSTITGNDADRNGGGIFKGGGPPATITNTTISGNTATYEGGGVAAADSPLTITGSTLSDNSAGNEGGGVYSDQGSLTIETSTVSGNGSGEEGGGVGVGNTAGTQSTEVVIRDSTVSGNDAGPAADRSEGGGIYLGSPDGASRIERLNVSGNRAEEGGGIYVDEDLEAAVTVDATTVSGNTTTEEGGGIYIDTTSDVPIVVQNTTVSGNSAGQEGGGIAVDGDEDSDDNAALIRNSTIAQNTAAVSGGGVYRSDVNLGGGAYSSDDLPISATIVADNSAPANPDLSQSSTINSGAGAFLLASSLIGAPAGATIAENPAGSNLLGVDPLLGQLADNGGSTRTHLPAASSPAIDKGTANGLGTDQRGLARTFDASNVADGAGDGTDIGAVELVAEGSCKGRAATVLFTPGQRIAGSGRKDVVVATGQADRISTKGGKDTVCAGKGKDKVKGGGGKDRLFGEAGKDTLKGGGGKDSLKGGGGKDKLRGGPGKDKLDGGPGKDSERQ